MTSQETYNVEFSNRELFSLLELLGDLRKIYADDRRNYRQDPLFIEACKLHFKFAKVANPETRVTLDDFLNY